jgi:hypothetical protein
MTRPLSERLALIQKWKVMLAMFPYGGVQRSELTPWAMSAAVWAANQKDIDGGLLYWSTNDTPITMTRNLAVKAAIHNEVDILVFCDSDMIPDIDKAHPFLPSAFKFIKSRWATAPTIISAPYCMGAPTYSPTMGRWRTHHNGYPIATALYTREEAAEFTGIQPCSLQGTGLMAIDMRIFTGFPIREEVIKLPPPFYYYEYTDENNSEKASTEDMVFSRNVTLLFAKHNLEIGFVDFDSWAYHIKNEFVGKPYSITIQTVAPLHKE